MSAKRLRRCFNGHGSRTGILVMCLIAVNALFVYGLFSRVLAHSLVRDYRPPEYLNKMMLREAVEEAQQQEGNTPQMGGEGGNNVNKPNDEVVEEEAEEDPFGGKEVEDFEEADEDESRMDGVSVDKEGRGHFAEIDGEEKASPMQLRLYKRLIWRSKGRFRYKRPDFIPFTYSNRTRWKGPIVEGWPPGTDRSIPKYIKPSQNTFLTRPRGSRHLAAKLLILVMSAPLNFEAREGIRRSWASPANTSPYNASVVFVLGTLGEIPTDGSADKKILEEQDKNGDILRVDVVDHYNNLTLKTLSSIKYLLKNDWKIQPEFMFKLDDDAYLHFPGLERTLKPLRSEIRRSDSNNFVLGKAFGDDNRPILPIRVPNRPYKRKTVHSKKWWCPGYMFDGKEYPKMVSGAGYVMNYGAAECVYKEILKLPYFHLEDVLITGFGSQACKLKIINSFSFKNSPSRIEDVSRNDVLVHYASSRAKNRIFKVLLFDQLQDRYNKALSDLGRSAQAFTVPTNDVHEVDIESEFKKKQKARMKMLQERLKKI